MSSQNSTATESVRETAQHSNARPSMFLVPMLKLPLILYRAGLGWLFGHRFMLVTHTGRRSGKVRYTVLAVLRFDPATREVAAISAWSASEWYKNIQAAPARQIETGFTRYVPAQRALSPEEIAALFDAYRRQHPIFSRIVCRIPGWKWDASPAEWLDLARTLRGVAFTPKRAD